MVQKQHDKALQLLRDNETKLHELASYLYEKETITGEEFMTILRSSSLDLEEITPHWE